MHLSQSPPPITLSDVSVSYGHLCALEEVTGSFDAGSLTAVIGPNGGGKSTLLKAIMGLKKPRTGSITPSSDHLETCVGYLPQQVEIDRTFPLKIEDFVAMGFWRHVGSWRTMTHRHHQIVHAALSRVGLEGLENRSLEALSGGQFQRVLFARLMVQDAPILFLDEPFTGVDQQTIQDLLSFIHEWHRAGKTIIAVLHDIDLVRQHFPRALLLSTRVLDWGPTATVLHHTKSWNVPLCRHEGPKPNEQL